MSLLAGNNSRSTPNTTSLANAQPLQFDVWVATDLIGILPATDEVIYNRGNAIAKISSSTGKLVDLAGGGSTMYTTADGLGLGSVQVAAAYYPKVLGANSNVIVAGLSSWNTTYTDGMLKTYNISNGVQSGFGGLTGTTAPSTWPSDGSTLSTSIFPHASGVGAMSYDATNGYWITYTTGGTNTVKTLTQGGTIANLFTDTGATVIRAVTSTRASGSLVVYYCASVGSSWIIRKWSQATSTFASLSWPSSSIACQANGLVYDSSSNKLIFIFTSNGLYGIAEYANP